MTLTVPTPRAGLAEHAARTSSPIDTLVKAWLSGQRSPRTVAAYSIAIRQWLDFCATWDIEPIGALRAHVELYQRHLEQKALKPRTIYARLTAMASFYGYLLVEDVLVRDPMRGVKRPRIERRSPTAWLSTAQVADLIAGAQLQGVHPYALVLILALNGLRIAEACSLNVTSIGWDGYSPIITFTRKGAKDGRATLSRPTEHAVFAAIGNVRGRHGRITPHSLRHSWCTGCRESGVPLDQIQHDGGWSDPRIAAYYSHGLDRPDRAATHGITARVMGAA